MRQVLLTDFNKFADNDFGNLVDKEIDPILGYNPSFLNGHEWKDRRADITPAFTASRVRQRQLMYLPSTIGPVVII